MIRGNKCIVKIFVKFYIYGFRTDNACVNLILNGTYIAII